MNWIRPRLRGSPRSWVLTLPYRLRYRLACDPRLVSRRTGRVHPNLSPFTHAPHGHAGFRTARGYRHGDPTLRQRSAAISSARRSPRTASAFAPTGASSSNFKTISRDGTSHFLDPIEFLEKLAVLVPRPVAVNLLLYHGVLASRAPALQVIRYGLPAPDAAAPMRQARPAGAVHIRIWAALMHRTVACRRGGGRLRVVATIQDPAVVRAFLAHLPLAPGPDILGPAPP